MAGDGDWTYISSGQNHAFALKEDGTIHSLENVAVQDNGNIQHEWLALNGHLKNISLHRGVAWGVYETNTIWRGDVEMARRSVLENFAYSWAEIDNDLDIAQVEIGEFGVFGTTENGDVYYRVGTHRNPGSAGTRWQLLNGNLSHVTSGFNNAYGVSSDGLAWQMKPNSFNDETGEFEHESGALWTQYGDKTGGNISAL